MMRILHTSDWHLGQEFHGYPREDEHQAFLSWLLDAVVAHHVDALLVVGDVYDSQNPPISAQRMLYRFIADLRARMPRLDMVLVGGNHDSAGRLEAPGPLLETLGVRVVGSLTRLADGGLDVDRLVLPLHDAQGQVATLCAAVPFLRLSDLPIMAGDGADDPLIWGVRNVYAQILAAAEKQRRPGQGLIVTGHCYMVGGDVSEVSERRILGGNQHALPIDIFPGTVTYAALGHLHKAQRVGGMDHIRYSGSPLPLSVAERDYRHQVVLVDVDGDDPVRVTPLPVPRGVDIVRVPAQGAAPVDQILSTLRAWPVGGGDLPRQSWPYLHVVVAADGPLPGLRRDVDDAIKDKALRLAHMGRGDDRVPVLSLSQDLPDLDELHPEDVFVQCWRGKHGGDPSADHLDAFRHLLEQVESDGGAA